MATIWPLFRWILTLFSVFIAFLCDNFCKKFQIGKEIFQIFFEKNFQSANLKILRWKLLEKFVFCHKILWMLNWKVKFGQNGPKINPKGPEMSIFLPKAKYGHICHENCGHISKNFMAKAIWNMATLAIYGHSWEHWRKIWIFLRHCIIVQLIFLLMRHNSHCTACGLPWLCPNCPCWPMWGQATGSAVAAHVS